MPSITSSNAANAIVKLVAAEALPALLGNLVMGNLVNRSYESDLAKQGDTVNVPIPPVLNANTKSSGGNVTRQTANLGNAQIVLNTHKEVSFTIDDVAKALASPDLLPLYMQPAIIALAEQIEGDLLGLYPQFTANPVLGLPGAALTEAIIDSAETSLFNKKVPPSEQKYLVVDGTTYGGIRQITRFSEWRTAQEAGVNALINGKVGMVKDFFVFRSQYVQKTGVAPVTTHNLAFAKNAMALVTRRLPKADAGLGVIQEYVELGNFGMRVTMGYDKDSLGTTMSLDVLYGTGILRAAHGVQVES
jgi:hypothetical protein